MGVLDFLRRKPDARIEELASKIDILGEKITDASQEIKKSVIPELPRGRQSYPDFNEVYENYVDGLKLAQPTFIIDMIPIIRKLFRTNQNLGLAVFDMVQLTNTGHRVVFDPEVAPDQVDLMRKHLGNVTKTWGAYNSDINAVINRWIAQIYVTGALCTEWVIKNDLSGIKNAMLVKPEYIRFSYRRNKSEYIPYQIVDSTINPDVVLQNKRMKKLNQYTFKYRGLISDVDEPYGIPPFLTALEDIAEQRNMKKNMSHIIQQIGLMGFLEVLIAKPDMKDMEKEDAYSARLTQLLQTTRDNVKSGLAEAISVGYKDDHEYEFHSTTKNMAGLPDVFDINQRMVAAGLKFPPSFLGISSMSETHINIVFTKMLSQLRNTQEIIKENLEFAYALELVLAGFSFNYLKVEFKPSTITDALKEQQTDEIRIRNVSNKYNMGIIGQDQAADELGYEKPDQKEPRAPIDESEVARQKVEKDKDAGDRKSRDKSKPQPKRADQDTRRR